MLSPFLCSPLNKESPLFLPLPVVLSHFLKATRTYIILFSAPLPSFPLLSLKTRPLPHFSLPCCARLRLWTPLTHITLFYPYSSFPSLILPPYTLFFLFLAFPAFAPSLNPSLCKQRHISPSFLPSLSSLGFPGAPQVCREGSRITREKMGVRERVNTCESPLNRSLMRCPECCWAHEPRTTNLRTRSESCCTSSCLFIYLFVCLFIWCLFIRVLFLSFFFVFVFFWYFCALFLFLLCYVLLIN